MQEAIFIGQPGNTYPWLLERSKAMRAKGHLSWMLRLMTQCIGPQPGCLTDDADSSMVMGLLD